MSVYNLTKYTWVICLGFSVIEEAGKGRHIYENDHEAQTHKHGLITSSGACNGRNRLTTAFRSPSTVCIQHFAAHTGSAHVTIISKGFMLFPRKNRDTYRPMRYLMY